MDLSNEEKQPLKHITSKLILSKMGKKKKKKKRADSVAPLCVGSYLYPLPKAFQLPVQGF